VSPNSLRRPRRPTGGPVALVTYRTSKGVVAEDRILAEAFRRRGVQTVHAIWDDPGVDWSAFELAIVRSTWDYFHDRPRFLAWIDRTMRSVELWNPPDVLRWNTEKRYLADLERKGVPTVPTAWVRKGSRPDIARIASDRGWGSLVVKRTVSAAGEKTFRFGPGERTAARAAAARLARTGGVMVQPYLDAIETKGERSLIYLGGRYSHAVRRVPIFPRHDPAAREPLVRATPVMRAVAEAAINAAPNEVLYARADLLPDGQGGWRLLELEVTEPSLFFVPHPRAADRLVSASLLRMRR
jgi:hypothetical protein